MAMHVLRRSVLVMLVLAACTSDDGGDAGGLETSAGDDGSTVAGTATGAPTTSGSDGDGTAEATSTVATDTPSDSTGAIAVDYVAQIQPIWDAACTCHLQGPSGTMTATTLTLNADLSYAELVGTTATQAALPRVAPGDPDGSYLWHKLQGTHEQVGGSGTAMPQIGRLSSEELDLIETWISAGAPGA